MSFWDPLSPDDGSSSDGPFVPVSMKASLDSNSDFPVVSNFEDHVALRRRFKGVGSEVEAYSDKMLTLRASSLLQYIVLSALARDTDEERMASSIEEFKSSMGRGSGSSGQDTMTIGSFEGLQSLLQLRAAAVEAIVGELSQIVALLLQPADKGLAGAAAISRKLSRREMPGRIPSGSLSARSASSAFGSRMDSNASATGASSVSDEGWALLEPIELERRCHELLQLVAACVRTRSGAQLLAVPKMVRLLVRLLLPPADKSIWSEGGDVSSFSPRC